MLTKKRLLIFLALIIGIITIFLSLNNLESNTQSYETISINDYPKDSRERYTASIAIENNITYEEADLMDKSYIEYNSQEYNDFTIEYKTFYELSGMIKSSEYEQEVFMDIEVRYLRDKNNKTFEKIDEIGGVILFLPNTDIKKTAVNSGDYNIEKYKTYMRISQTAVIEYFTAEAPEQLSEDIVNIENKQGKYQITTGPKTYSIEIIYKELQ